jgi:hypothetical protein
MHAKIKTVRTSFALLALTTVIAGCGVSTEIRTVQDGDTYSRWYREMDRIPFLFHYPDGRLEAFNDHGEPLGQFAAAVEAERGDRVEIYVGHFDGPAKSLCYSTPDTLPTNSGPTVVSALCDHERSVVSFSDHAQDQVLAAKSLYVARARSVLLNGISESPVQEANQIPY